MRESNRRFNESVEQPSQSHPCPDLVTCRHCGRSGLPERIAAHDCNTAIAEVTHVQLHVATLLSSTTHDDTPHPSSQQEPEQPPLEELTITWTPTHGPTRSVTFEHTATGWQHNNTTTTDTPSHTTVGEPASPPTLELIATTEEGHHE